MLQLSFPIYSDQAAYNLQSSKGSNVSQKLSHAIKLVEISSGNSKFQNEQETWVQCHFCYDEWHKEINLRKKWREKRIGLIFLCILIGILIGLLITKLLVKNDDKSLKMFFLFFGLGLSSFGYFIGDEMNKSINGTQPTVDRWRIRERKINLSK